MPFTVTDPVILSSSTKQNTNFNDNSDEEDSLPLITFKGTHTNDKTKSSDRMNIITVHTMALQHQSCSPLPSASTVTRAIFPQPEPSTAADFSSHSSSFVQTAPKDIRHLFQNTCHQKILNRFPRHNDPVQRVGKKGKSVMMTDSPFKNSVEEDFPLKDTNFKRKLVKES